MEKQEIKTILTVPEVARILKISKRTIYNQTSRKAKKKFPIKHFRVGKSIRFDIEDLNKYLKTQKNKS